MVSLDALTGIPNRRMMAQELTAALAVQRAGRDS